MRMKHSALALALLIASAWVQARDYAYSDAHLHYVDFFQETEGMSSLLQVMAKNRITHVMISGIPVAKNGTRTSPSGHVITPAMMLMPIGIAQRMCGLPRLSSS